MKGDGLYHAYFYGQRYRYPFKNGRVEVKDNGDRVFCTEFTDEKRIGRPYYTEDHCRMCQESAKKMGGMKTYYCQWCDNYNRLDNSKVGKDENNNNRS